MRIALRKRTASRRSTKTRSHVGARVFANFPVQFPAQVLLLLRNILSGAVHRVDIRPMSPRTGLRTGLRTIDIALRCWMARRKWHAELRFILHERRQLNMLARRAHNGFRR